MSTEIVVALISLGGSLLTAGLTIIGVIHTNNTKQKIIDVKQEESLKALEQSVNNKLEVFKVEFNAEIKEVHKAIDSLDAKQTKHNNLIERTYALETAVKVLDEKQKSETEVVTTLMNRRRATDNV